MKKLFTTLFALIALSGTAQAAVLVFSPNGTYTAKASLTAAATAADASNKTIVVTSPQAVTTAIAWPSDRELVFDKGGYVTFSGAGSLTGLRTARPEWFGANTSPGTTDMSVAIQKAFDSLNKTDGGVIVFAASTTYKISTGIVLPKQTANQQAVFEIQGNNAVITASTDITMMGLSPTDMADQTGYSQQQGMRYFIRGLKFLGNNATNQKALVITGTYGSYIENCNFTATGIGLELNGALMPIVQSCITINCAVNGFIAQGAGSTGTAWSGASVNTVQSNGTIFQSCRVFNTAASIASFKILNSSGVELRDCIIEGADPDYGVYFDVLGATTVKDFTIKNLHGECQPSVAMMWVKPNGGAVNIESGFYQLAGTTVFIDAGQFYDAPANINVSNIGYWAGLLKTSTPTVTQWYFSGMPYNSILTAAYWVGGAVPDAITVAGYQTAGGPLNGIRSSGDYDIKAVSNLSLIGATVKIKTGNAAASTVLTAPGTVTNKYPIYDASGSLIGYIPVYAATSFN